MRNIIFIFIFLLFIPLLAVNAQSDEGIIISPNIIDEQAKAGAILKYKIKIKNNLSHRADIYAMVNDLSVVDGRQEFIDPSYLDKTTSLARWINFKRGVIEIMPGEEAVIPLEIKVKSVAVPGKRFASIAFPVGSNRSAAEESMKKKSYAQLLINLDIQDESIEKAQILKFNADKNTFLGWPAKINYTIKNIGNTDIKPSGFIYFYNRRGEEVDRVAVKPEVVQVGKTVERYLLWDGGDGKRMGKYKAKIELEYGDKEALSMQDTAFFWMLPWLWLLIFAGSLMLIVFLTVIVLFRKTYKYRHHQHIVPPKNFKGKKIKSAKNNGVLDLKNK